MSLGALYVVSGPSGAGKSTVCKLVREKLGINLSISATSRKPRTGEENGIDYFFLSPQEFEEKIQNGEFLEYANVHGNYYGTLKSEVEERLKNSLKELEYEDKYEQVIINNKIEQACEDLISIIEKNGVK